MIVLKVLQIVNIFVMFGLLIVKIWGNDDAKEIGEKYFWFSIILCWIFFVPKWTLLYTVLKGENDHEW